MKRIERVYQQLVNQLKTKNETELLEMPGCSANDIAEQTGLTRSNASLELNNLVRQQRVVKVKSFPVRYLPVALLEDLLQTALPDEVSEIEDFGEFMGQKRPAKTSPTSLHPAGEKPQTLPVTPNLLPRLDPLDNLIGAKGSLKKAVSQAKAAIYYPPHGLHMLLVGPTGSGKTLFANRIYQFGLYEKVLKPDAPFVAFNCADYYHNPQLLLSQLFGHGTGAYTGAGDEKEGLVAQADGGVLLLDEIHRLPPEGQEMLFYFIDNGVYHRLGETGVARHADVLIICATTEDPNSALLQTFLRRIPMSIQIPSLLERSIEERIQLVKFLFSKEAERIQKKLRVHIDVMNALISANPYGNVGQLKSNVQLVCAQGFLHGLNQGDFIDLTVNHLPEEMQKEWLYSSENIKRSQSLNQYLEMTTLIAPAGTADFPLDQEEEPVNLYQVIEEKVHLLEENGVAEADIQQYIITDLHLHIRNFVKSNQHQNFQMMKFVEDEVISLTEELKGIAENELKQPFDRRFNYFVALHMDAFFKRGKQESVLSISEMEEIRQTHPAEYRVALLFKDKIQETYKVTIPDIELLYLTMLIHSIRGLEEKKKVSILVVAHGLSTATSMVSVAKELLGDAPIEALDMPLTQTPQEMTERLVSTIRQLNQGKGVLILADMGSLVMLEERLREETGVPLKTVSGVSTVMVLDAVRKVNYLDLDLPAIYDSVWKDFLSYLSSSEASDGKPQAIVSICMSGSGTAARLKEMVTNLVYQFSDHPVEVITVSAVKMAEEIKQVQQTHHIIASVGTKNPKLEVPFISLEELIEGSGSQVLQTILSGKGELTSPKPQTNVVVKDLVEDTLKNYLVFLNPYWLTTMLQNWMGTLERRLSVNFANSLMIKCIVHTAFALERAVKDDQLDYDETEITPNILAMYPIVEETLNSYCNQLDVTLSRDEKLFIANLLVDNL